MPASPIAVLAFFAACCALSRVGSAQVAEGLAAVAERFSAFDLNDDGVVEIRDCVPIGSHASALPTRVLGLVEARLAGDAALRGRWQRWGEDLGREGLGLDLLAVELPGSGVDFGRHRDGELVLALRELLRAWHGRVPGLRAAVLVGHFPDALVVRTVSWRKRERLITGEGTDARRDWGVVPLLRRVPEIVAHRADVVLGDLDGSWESRWVEGPAELETVHAVFDGPVPDGGGTALAVELGSVTRRDFFLVEDGACQVTGREVVLDAAARDHECAPGDRQLPNPLVQPELQVGRIDARGLVCRGTGSETWFDAAWERQLLLAYFDDNHAFRSRPAGESFRPASAGHELGSGMDHLRRASAAWEGFSEPGYDLHAGVDLLELTAWMQIPAVLRTLRAHSGPHHAVFARGDDSQGLARLLGIESLPGEISSRLAQGRADAAYWRALWRFGALSGTAPFLLLHHGCEALSPPASSQCCYDDPRYGRDAHGAALLMFTPAVAILGRAKVFYDHPRGFGETLASGGTIGDAWQEYFRIEAASRSRREVGGDIGRKRAMFWSVLGDPTLRLPWPQ